MRHRYTLLLEGISRIRVQSIEQVRSNRNRLTTTRTDIHAIVESTPTQETPYIKAQVEHVQDIIETTKLDKEGVVEEFREASRRLIELLKTRVPLVAKFQPLLDSTVPEKLCDLFVGAIDATFDERLAILNEPDVLKRFDLSLKLVTRQLLVLGAAGSLVDKESAGRATVKLRGDSDSASKAKNKSSASVAADDDDDEEDTVARLTQRIEGASLPEAALKAARRELRKIKGMERSQSMGPEHQKAVAYVEWLTDLPWATKSRSNDQQQGPLSTGQPDLKAARAALDRDHFGLDKVKRRIVEYVAVHHLNPKGTGTILCLVGPPGVGKTSLGKSIASCLGREFLRISLGGIRDESDIRGFSRTYVGSQPGRLLQGMKEVKSNDPVLLLDEIDKISLGSSVSGDPSSALLEVKPQDQREPFTMSQSDVLWLQVLDPAQNSTFVDRYIAVPYDLSKVLFIATANSIDTIPAPLLDRMEVIQLPGYTMSEKLAIASR